MNIEDAEEYTQSLGQIFAGSWRQIAWAHKQGVPAALGLDTKQWVEERLGGYVKMSILERHAAAQELKAEGYNTREIGNVLGVAHSTIVRDGANAPLANIDLNEIREDAVGHGANAPDETTGSLVSEETKVYCASFLSRAERANKAGSDAKSFLKHLNGGEVRQLFVAANSVVELWAPIAMKLKRRLDREEKNQNVS